MNDAELLALHRNIVGIPSVSHEEHALCEYLETWLCARDVRVKRFGNNLVAVTRDTAGGYLCFNSHLDTVPASPRWTRSPFDVEVVDGHVFGLGSNDAKASVAAMIAAFLRLRMRRDSPALMLALGCDEETGGRGAEVLLPHLQQCGFRIEGAVIGEPTGLDIAISQKGLLLLELRSRGRACHAAHARALGAPNALRLLAQDLVALDGADLGPEDPILGPVTVEPTMAHAGISRNTLPAEASCILDVRTNPSHTQAEITSRLQALVRGDLVVVSDRLSACEIDSAHRLVVAARQARPQARLLGSRAVSDWVWFSAHQIPAIKTGPGQTERSHTPDEYVLESEILDAAEFYANTALAYGAGLK